MKSYLVIFTRLGGASELFQTRMTIEAENSHDVLRRLAEMGVPRREWTASIRIELIGEKW